MVFASLEILLGLEQLAVEVVEEAFQNEDLVVVRKDLVGFIHPLNGLFLGFFSFGFVHDPCCLLEVEADEEVDEFEFVFLEDVI